VVKTAGGISASRAARIAFGKGGWEGRLFDAGAMKAFVRFWPFATKSDIRAEDRTKWRDISPLADRFNSPV
jgi:hypothetical protein